MEAKANSGKKEVVKEFTKLLEEYPIIGCINMEGLPTPQLQNMRATLRDTVLIKMSKRRLMKLAIENIKDKKNNITELLDLMRGMPALLFTKENPFKLFKILQKNKSNAPAKAGQIAPKDIVVPAGPTPFAPGPVIGELGALGIKSGVVNGKIEIKEDKVVIKEGEVINSKVASILSRLGIEPMEIGLDLIGVWEKEVIYGKNILAVDEEKYKENITKAHNWSLNLSVYASIFNKSNIEIFINKAHKHAFNLAINENIISKDVIEELLAKAGRQSLALKQECKL